ncbi:MAG TPA: DMT family transporter, partial [Planctomycetota bacterium]|nr:DMT family transporter [Planctomycetota bacterium]
MVAFAANSLLCRLALRETEIDAATFTGVRILSGALALALLVRARGASTVRGGDWVSAAALFAYAIAFSFAYRELSAGTGALLLFGAVQACMILWGWQRGERPIPVQVAGFALAVGGLVWLVWPRVTAPPLLAASSMLVAGIAWGIYSLRGRGVSDPLASTAGNFLRAVPFALVAVALGLAQARFPARGVALAAVSGAVTSGVGYAVWYSALRSLDATRAATVQLCVPLLAVIGGAFFLDERLDRRVLVAAATILGGIGLVVTRRTRRKRNP